MFVIGLTGGIGCGKSTVAQICREAGLPVIDADELSRAATGAGGAAMPELIALFGPAITDATGALDRQKMARLVFADRRALDQLSSVVHRHVLEAIRRSVDAWAEKKARAVLIDVPIPVRHGFVDLCDQIWVVWTRDEIRLARLRQRGMDEAEAQRRMRMQMTREEYVGLADHVIENDGSFEDLSHIVQTLLDQELGERGIRLRR
jgi:dephospho-CoA kinase